MSAGSRAISDARDRSAVARSGLERAEPLSREPVLGVLSEFASRSGRIGRMVPVFHAASEEIAMHLPEDAELLRVFVGESDKRGGVPLYEAIVCAAREHGLAGATVLRGILGFGAHSRIHTAKILRLSEDLPMVVEIVDKSDRIASFLPVLDAMIGEGLVTLEKVRVIAYRHGDSGASGGAASG